MSMNTSIRLLLLLILLFPVCLQAKERASAEERKRERTERMHKAWLKQMEDRVNRQKTNNQSKMKLRLEFLQRAVGLDEKQMEHLNMAAKGAVERASQSWLEYKEKEWKAEQQNRYIRDQMDKNKVDPIHREVWTEALEETLTSKQKRKYQMEMGIRATYLGNALMRIQMSMFDQRALLTRKQRDELIAKLETSLTIPLKDVTPQVVSAAVQKAYTRLKLEEQQEILTKEQQALWLQFISRIEDITDNMDFLEEGLFEMHGHRHW